MSQELIVLCLMALLQPAIILLAGASMNRDVGASWNAGPRDDQPAFSKRTGRLRRALSNHVENLPLFIIAVLALELTGRGSPLTAALAWVALAMRVLYVPAYALAWTPWRSVIFGVGLFSTLLMILIALLS
ncbi:MAPEG family protein [Frigidibacter sp. MR17.14]|uniref:MAPEG family protein n=1 Tax=Frigidibacter sp. MR17.14 TaxID=3126509 RepID=UPI003012E21A